MNALNNNSNKSFNFNGSFQVCNFPNEDRMYLEELNTENLSFAIKMQHELFPLENGHEDLKASVYGVYPPYQTIKFWLVKINDKYVGITGIFSFDFAPEDAWLGWFGVIKSERNKGFGSKILETSINIAKKMGYKSFRVYTDEVDNANAVKLYRNFNMLCEVYDNPDDRHFEISKTLIFSKSLSETKVTLWNNKNLYIQSHDIKNQKH